MDYEKKYKETLERARQFSEHPLQEDSSNIVEYIFPELQESKDERIRKEIIETFKNLGDGKIPVDINYADIFTWLEKQGEQKPIKMWHDVSEVPDEMQELLVEWESPDATWHDIAFHDAETKAFRHLKQPINNVTRWAYVSDILSQSVTKTSEQGWSDALEKQGEQKPTDEDMKEALRTEYEKGRADAIAQMQKEWSEEDKDFMYDTLSNLTELKDRYGEGYGNVGKCIDWLKILKQRIGGEV